MAEQISISLNSIQDIREVKIKGLGVLKIRKLGSGEDLDLSFKQRQMNKLITELTQIDFTKFDVKKASDMKKIEKLAKRAEEISAEVDEIKRYEYNVYKRLLSDNKDGKVVDVIMNTLSDRERAEIFKIAFGDKKQVETPEVIGSEDA